MQINGLEREGRFIAGDSQDVTRGVLLPNPQKQPCSPAFRRILIVISALGDVSGALRVACALADGSQGEIVVLEAASQAEGIQSLVDDASWLDRASKTDLLEIRRSCLDSASINEVAQKYACDLVILGMESQRDELRMMNRSVAEEVFPRLNCPALVFGPKVLNVPSAGPDGPIIFATSFQDRSMAAIVLASKVANLCSSPLECVHVLPTDLAGSTKGYHIIPQIMRDALVAGAKQYHVSVRPDQCHILYGRSVSGAIARFATLRKAHFIVLGVRQSGPVVSHLQAGIASSVILFAPCPVLTLGSSVGDVN